MIKRKIYLASSWRNTDQPRIVKLLRAAGHQVYDFKNPVPGNTGFAWSNIDRNWLSWTPEEFRYYLYSSDISHRGFKFDRDALCDCDTCVLLLPCGRSAHLAAGYAAGQGTITIVYLSPDKFEPELMYKLGHGCVVSDEELLQILREE